MSPELPVLIAGPTASGKSGLALQIAAAQGGVIVNADALQVFGNWRVLTARPSPEEEAQAPHRLYGHVAGDKEYSVGHWLRDLAPHLSGGPRPIIVGGTGLNFSALTEGLAEIPPTPAEIRAEADALRTKQGTAPMLAELDADTLSRIDQLNPMRVQRAWEVQRATGRGIAAWQNETPAPLLPLSGAQPILLSADRDWLNARIDRRFDIMVAGGALEEARQNLADWDPAWPSAKAIGAAGLIAHLRGNRDLKDAVAEGKRFTRQYAKRQRTWFRSRMGEWRAILLD
ncbi:tRNA (adenosine(37)-N6)-dimethylallyltransferase MiaA [Candidatus Rhodobacter oscarellae]|uniref:tRNA (adenosine(37)-N6)-dimethylallyltransferase MiaA n=1 Tax=Candidatus Rhodobacter oscarellae TaxID=1675527 RepID=UPI002E0FADC0